MKGKDYVFWPKTERKSKAGSTQNASRSAKKNGDGKANKQAEKVTNRE